MRLLRRRLILLALVGILPLAAMSGLGLRELANRHRIQGEQAAIDISRALAIAVDGALGESVAVLDTLATAVQLDAGYPTRFNRSAQRVMALQPAWLFIHLADPSGAVVLNTKYQNGGTDPPIIPEKESFRIVLETLRPTIGNLLRAPHGEWGVPVRVPVLRNGHLRYVLSGIIKPDTILDVVNRQRVPPEWVVSVFDAKGVRVARSRDHEAFIGNPAPAALQSLMEKGSDEGYGLTTALEGERVQTAFTRSKQTGWVVAIGTPDSMTQAGIYRSLAVFGGGILLSLVFAVLAAVRITRSINRPIRELANATCEIGRGEPLKVPATDIREIAELSSALAASDAAVKTSRKQAEVASQAKDEFLAMLGHELRNPLAPIVTALRLMEMRKDDSSVSERRVIERQVAHLSRLVDDLLDISRITQGKIELDLKRVSMMTVVTGALEMTQPLLEKRSKPIDVQMPTEPVYARGDATRLTQVLANLLSNAARYTPNDGRIALQVGEVDGMVQICVEDSGTGIAAELLPRVFAMFVQGRQSIDRRVGGLGLGLAIVKALVQLHGGTVEAMSKGPNLGSTFVVRLPKAEINALSGPRQDRTSTIRTKQSGKVLVVDDNVDAAETLALLLRSAGYEIHTAADAEARCWTSVCPA
ncbi:MAG: ATP-binding protein [Betaproteobacteria bacterium]